MGTNFFWNTSSSFVAVNKEDPKIHIGKRQSAGPFCWDCHKTLCKQGEDAIHTEEAKWYDKCPVCGKDIKEESLSEGHSSGVELGFSRPKQEQKKGIMSCSSFSWAQNPNYVRKICSEKSRKQLIVDEYGKKYTGKQFLEMLQFNCPIEFTKNIGVQFS